MCSILNLFLLGSVCDDERPCADVSRQPFSHGNAVVYQSKAPHHAETILLLVIVIVIETPLWNCSILCGGGVQNEGQDAVHSRTMASSDADVLPFHA